MQFIQIAFTMIVSYAAAAMLSEHVSMDLTQTNWTSLWTYFWWAIALPVVGIIAMALAGLAVAIFAAFNR